MKLMVIVCHLELEICQRHVRQMKTDANWTLMQQLTKMTRHELCVRVCERVCACVCTET